MLTGTVGAQIIALAALPFLSRLFTPEDFGYFSLVLALSGLVAPSANLRFDTAAMLPERVEEVRALVWNAIIVSLVTAIVFGIALAVLGSLGVGEVGKHPYLPLWVPVIVALTALYALFSQLALRKQQYALVSRRSLVRSVVMATTQIGLGVAGRGGDGLVVGSVVGNAIGIASMVLRTREFFVFPSREELTRVWRTYWRFPAVFAPSALLNSIGLQAPILFFTIYFGIAQGGQLGMAERIVGIPLTIIGVAIGQVIDAEVSKRIRERRGQLRRSYLRFSLALTVIGAVIAIGFGFLGGWVVPWILGEQWKLAGHMVQILALTSGIRLVASPLSRFLLLLQKSAANILLDVVRVVIMGGSMTTVLLLDMELVPAMWLVYAGLSVTYLATWAYGLWAVRDAPGE